MLCVRRWRGAQIPSGQLRRSTTRAAVIQPRGVTRSRWCRRSALIRQPPPAVARRERWTQTQSKAENPGSAAEQCQLGAQRPLPHGRQRFYRAPWIDSEGKKRHASGQPMPAELYGEAGRPASRALTPESQSDAVRCRSRLAHAARSFVGRPARCAGKGTTAARSCGQHPHTAVRSNGSRPCRHSWSASRPTRPASIGHGPPPRTIAAV